MALLLAMLVGLALVAVGSVGSSWATAPLRAQARTLDGQAGPSSINRAALASITWRGGAITTSTGQVVNVFVSDALPLETPEKWAEFIAKLTHGPEISQLDSRLATLAEVQDLCGGSALGCYGQDEMISLGEVLPEGTTPEEVVRHEYGHHIAAHRQNSPWLALDWGPKHWASAANVCVRVQRREAFPGDGGRNYSRNPGEAWAETYRLMDERKNGITTARWPIIVPGFFPDEAALVAAERDVTQPWTARTTSTFRRTFAKGQKKVWWIPLPTALDGELNLNATLPRNGGFDVSIVGANRKTVVKRAQWVGQRSKRTAVLVCGQRSLFVRVAQTGTAGRVTVSVTRP